MAMVGMVRTSGRILMVKASTTRNPKPYNPVMEPQASVQLHHAAQQRESPAMNHESREVLKP